MDILPQLSAVYRIICITTKKFYVGSSVNVARRWRQHRATLRRGEHGSIYLQRAWDKYGESAFEIEVIEFVERDRLTEREQHYITCTGCCDPLIGFNMSPTAGSPRGIIRSSNTKSALAESTRKTWEDPAIRAKRQEWVALPGAKDEHRKRIGAGNATPKARQNRSEAATRRWQDPESRAQQRARQKIAGNTPDSHARRSAAMTALWARRKRVDDNGDGNVQT